MLVTPRPRLLGELSITTVYQITHSSEGKTITFTPHQVVIKDFKDPQNVLATRIVDDITRC